MDWWNRGGRVVTSALVCPPSLCGMWRLGARAIHANAVLQLTLAVKMISSGLDIALRNVGEDISDVGYEGRNIRRHDDC